MLATWDELCGLVECEEWPHWRASPLPDLLQMGVLERLHQPSDTEVRLRLKPLDDALTAAREHWVRL